MSSLKECYEPLSEHKAFFTGSEIVLSSNGQSLFCLCGCSVNIVDLTTGLVRGQLGDEPQSDETSDEIETGDEIYTFCLSSDNTTVATYHKSGLFKLWNVADQSVIKHWKSVHRGPVSKLALSPDGSVLASGGCDSSIRLWDLRHHSCTHNLTGIQGVVSIVKFHTKGNQLRIYGVADDAVIKCWDCTTGTVLSTMTGHYSKVTGLEITPDAQYIVSCGRDKVLILWRYETGAQVHVIPLYESVEGMALLPDRIRLPGQSEEFHDGIYVAVGGTKGVLRIWDALHPKELYIQNDSYISEAITHVLYNETTSAFTVASADHNVMFHDGATFTCTKQLVGFTDEILEVIIVGKEESHVAVASNSNDVKLYRIDSMNCQLLRAHSDMVLSLTASEGNPNIFASSSKDNSIKIWLLENDSASCVGSALGHGKSVTAIAFSHVSSGIRLFSGSEDTTLKLWTLPDKLKSGENSTLVVKFAKIAHDKDINAVAVSPNDKIIATASLDKTAKLWSGDDLSLLGTLRGHRRGVWSVCFSPSDQVVLTSSSDMTVKIWSITDLSCVKSLEGHDSAVMKARFLSRGLQVISTGGDGIIKLWSVKTGESVASFDHHDGKVWAIAVSKTEEKIVTGGSDSKLIFWIDVTEEKKLKAAEAAQEKALKEQELSNLLKSDDLINALRLALSLDRPATVLKIIQESMDKGDTCLPETIGQLDDSEKLSLLKCATHWNTNSKSCYPAQVLISFFLKDILQRKISPPKHILESLIPYTDKHMKRLTGLLQDLYLLEYTEDLMKPAGVASLPNELVPN